MSDETSKKTPSADQQQPATERKKDEIDEGLLDQVSGGVSPPSALPPKPPQV